MKINTEDIPFPSFNNDEQKLTDFSKQDLETGMIALTRRGDYYIVNRTLGFLQSIKNSKTLPTKYISKDLHYRTKKGNHTIVKVFTSNNLVEVMNRDLKSLKLIWERKD